MLISFNEEQEQAKAEHWVVEQLERKCYSDLLQLFSENGPSPASFSFILSVIKQFHIKICEK